MKNLFLILVLLLSKLIYAYDVNMTVFTLSENKGAYTLEIEFVKHDLEKELVDINVTTISNYIHQHTSWSINGEKLSFSGFQIVENKNSLKVICYSTAINLPGEVKYVDLKNDCLLQSFPNQYNIINLLLFDKKRAFRMDAKKRELSIKYE